MKRRLKDRKGFTLAEILIVVALMALLTAAGAAGISGVMASRVGMIQAADAEVLGSTALQAVANELRFGRNITVSANSITLDSSSYGIGTVIKEENGKLKFNDSDGHLFSENAYSGLKITGLTFEKDGDDAIKITVTVSGDRGELWTGGFDVVPMNGFAVVAGTPE